MPGLGAELTRAEGKGAEEALRQVLRALFDSGRKDENRVAAGHLGKAGDGVGASGGEVHEGAAGSQGTGEGDGGNAGMLDECGADLRAGVIEHGEGARDAGTRRRRHR